MKRPKNPETAEKNTALSTGGPLDDVALVAAPPIVRAAAMSLSAFREEVRVGRAPAPVIRRNRHVRWAVADIRRWLLQRAGRVEG